MAKNTVLVVSYYFPPMGLSGVQRTLKFVKYLPIYDWKPIVLTTSSAKFYAFDETLNRELPEEDYKIYRTESDDTGFARDIKYKTKKFPSYLTQKLGIAVLQTIYQPDSKRPWLKHAIKKGNEIIKKHKIDVIYATAPPFTDFLVAKKLSQIHDIPFIVDYRDVWIDNPFHFYATPFHKFYSSNLERDILTHAEKVIVTIRNTKELLLKRHGFLSYNDIDIISHGFDPEDFDEFKDIKPSKDKFIITHSGIFQDNRTPKYFLQAISELFKKYPQATSDIELRFVGIMRKSHKNMIKKYGLTKNTVETGYISHKESVRQLCESHLLWFMLNDTVRSPGKLYEYFAAKKPILACVPVGSIKKQVELTNNSITTVPKDVKAIMNGINTFYDLWKSNKLPIADDSFIEQFDRKKLTGELAKLLELAIEL